MSIRPFSEDNLFETGNETDSFYVTGSLYSVGEDPGSFSNGLRNKEQIKLTFNVSSKTSMLPNSSSIYYYNKNTGNWSLPTRLSSYVNDLGVFKNFSVNTGGKSSNLANGSFFIEDHLLFDYKGRSLGIGSLSVYRVPEEQFTPTQKLLEASSNFSGNESLSLNRQGELTAKDLPDSVQRSTKFDAVEEETFTIDNKFPFLIEKVVFEIPFCFGSGWFYDKSTLCNATSSLGDFTLNGSPSMGAGNVNNWSILDQGGPALTVALMSQKNYGTGKIRDLICKSIVTHNEDAKYEIKLNQIYPGQTFSPATDYWYVNTAGIITGSNDTVVSCSFSGTDRFFTGSVVVKSITSIENGCKLSAGAGGYTPLFYTVYTDLIERKLSEPYFKVTSTSPSSFGDVIGLLGINTFGRGMTGFSPSGASIFGGEYSMPNTGSLLFDGSVKNPFYIDNSVERQATYNYISSSVIDNRNFFTNKLNLTFISDVFPDSERPSPYLLYPGEKLILTISKTRPALKNFKINVDTGADPNADIYGIPTYISSSFYNDLRGAKGHDVQMNTGSINITLYGSYVRAGNSYVP